MSYKHTQPSNILKRIALFVDQVPSTRIFEVADVAQLLTQHEHDLSLPAAKMGAYLLVTRLKQMHFVQEVGADDSEPGRPCVMYRSLLNKARPY